MAFSTALLSLSTMAFVKAEANVTKKLCVKGARDAYI
jgi:hypothetical protein